MEEPRPIFMTGGWDSIFRLLQLLLIDKRAVQPVYILDPERWSVIQELKAMAKIKRAVRERYPESEALLPTLIYHRTDVQFDQAIKDAELCVEHTDSGCNPSVRDHLVVGEDGIKRVDPSKRGQPEHTLYGAFSFPTFTLSKTDMHDIAAGNGFLDILEMSWFWHRPTLWNEPCGTCNPCKSAMTKGIEHRIPAYGRFRYRLMQNTTPLILLKKIPCLHEKAKRLQVWFKSHG